jgi:hypothetical protein
MQNITEDFSLTQAVIFIGIYNYHHMSVLIHNKNKEITVVCLRDLSGDINDMIILKWILEKEDMKINAMKCLRIASNSEIL